MRFTAGGAIASARESVLITRVDLMSCEDRHQGIWDIAERPGAAPQLYQASRHPHPRRAEPRVRPNCGGKAPLVC
jgi:hypothetical protein